MVWIDLNVCRLPIFSAHLNCWFDRFDGNVPHWYHAKCFLGGALLPRTRDLIKGFSTLRPEDQALVKEKIPSGNAAANGTGAEDAITPAAPAPATGASRDPGRSWYAQTPNGTAASGVAATLPRATNAANSSARTRDVYMLYGIDGMSVDLNRGCRKTALKKNDTERTYFDETVKPGGVVKDRLHTMGARFDTMKQRWYVPPMTELAPFADWLVERQYLVIISGDTWQAQEQADTERDAVKELGACWSLPKEQWFVPPGMDLEPFKKWIESDDVSDMYDDVPAVAAQPARADRPAFVAADQFQGSRDGYVFAFRDGKCGYFKDEDGVYSSSKRKDHSGTQPPASKRHCAEAKKTVKALPKDVEVIDLLSSDDDD